MRTLLIFTINLFLSVPLSHAGNLDPIKFEKLIYHTTDCLLSCPVIDLEIDSSKNIYLAGKFYADFWKTGQVNIVDSGQFAGVINDSLYNELIYLLQDCDIKNLEYQNNKSIDAPTQTIIVYINNQRKYLKSSSPPKIIFKLINFLNDIHASAALEKTNEKRILEK